MDVLTKPAEEFENDQQVEIMWAMRAFEHAEVYYNIISSVDPSQLKLTLYDDLIYKIFREEFPTLDIFSISEEQIKSPSEKALWRTFCERFKFVEDYSFGTLLRLHALKDISESNTTLVPRIQFLAIEIARNREGVNKHLRFNYKQK